MASLGRAVAAEGLPLAAPACLIAGGESTVSLKRLGGVGGRNQELALAAAIALDDPRWAGISLASFGTCLLYTSRYWPDHPEPDPT